MPMTSSSDRLWLRLMLVACCSAASAEAQAPAVPQELDDSDRDRLLSKHARGSAELSEALAVQISGAEQAAKDAALEREAALADLRQAKTESL